MARKTCFKCVVCGKLTAGRISRGTYFEGVGDGSARFPRRHKGLDDKLCAGNIQEVEWVDVDKP
jgi:hypothetical protein